MQNGFVNTDLARYLKCTNGQPAKFYGLPKLHKFGSPLYNISKYINIPINKILGQTERHIEDSWDFLNKMKNNNIPDWHEVFSLDVNSLFTNIPLELVIKAAENNWHKIKEHMKLPLDYFKLILTFCLENAYCIFRNNFFKQISGVPMGSPIFATVADLVMEELEKQIID